MNDRIPGTTWDNPIWYREWRIHRSDGYTCKWCYVHDDYDGAEDGNDDRYGYCETIEDCKAEIDERWPRLP